MTLVSYLDNENFNTNLELAIDNSILQIHLPDSKRTINLTSSQFENWFATLEKEIRPNLKDSDYLASTQFLSRFGLNNSEDVITFLKSPAGQSTLTLIAEELIKIEFLNAFQTEQAREEALLRERMLYLLMSLMAKKKEHEKQISEITQQINEKLFKGMKEQLRKQDIMLAELDAKILVYTKAIAALDHQLDILENSLRSVDLELAILDEESKNLTTYNEHIDEHFNQLDVYLNLLLSQTKSIDDYNAFINQQVLLLPSQIKEFKEQQHLHINDLTYSKKIKSLEDRLAIFETQVQQPPNSIEQVLEQLIKHVHIQIDSNQSNHQTMPIHQHNIEGLKLQKRGLNDALQVVRKEKILLNSQLEPVECYNKACFIIDANHQGRYRKHGNTYAILPKHVDPNNVSDQEWTQAKAKYEKKKCEIQPVHVYHHDQIQQKLKHIEEKKEQQLKLREVLFNRKDELKATKVDILKSLSSAKAQRDLLRQVDPNIALAYSPKPSTELTANTPKVCPKPSPKIENSYSMILPSLAPTNHPIPSIPLEEDISKVSYKSAVMKQKLLEKRKEIALDAEHNLELTVSNKF